MERGASRKVNFKLPDNVDGVNREAGGFQSRLRVSSFGSLSPSDYRWGPTTLLHEHQEIEDNFYRQHIYHREKEHYEQQQLLQQQQQQQQEQQKQEEDPQPLEEPRLRVYTCPANTPHSRPNVYRPGPSVVRHSRIVEEEEHEPSTATTTTTAMVSVSDGNAGSSGPFTDLVLPGDWAEVCKIDGNAMPKSSKMAQPTLNQLVAFHSTGKKKEVKTLVRNGHWPVDHGSRAKLWPFLVRLDKGKTETDLESIYNETCAKLFRKGGESSSGVDADTSLISLPAFVDAKHLIHHKLSPSGQKAVARVIACLAYNKPAITYAPVLYSQAALLLHYLKEHEVFAVLSYLTESSKYVAQTQRAHDLQWRIVMNLCKKYARSAFNYLLSTVQTTENLERVFQNWTWWIFRHLPFPHLVRVMDCFLVEGPKVLYRVAFAIVMAFYQKQSSRSKVAIAPGDAKAMDAAISDYCRNIPMSSAKLLQQAFGIRRFSWDDVERTKASIEEALASGDGANNASGHSETVVRARSTDVCLPSDSAVGSSKTMTVDQLMLLWTWIPVRMTMCTPTLLFTTEEHGYNLRLLYELVEEHEPTVILVKTFKDEVFGAYCSTRWKERNMKDERGARRRFFGTGESFVFSFVPEAKKYRWVGLDFMDAGDAGCIRHAAELFQSGDRDMLTVGGGKGAALWLDADLRYGKTERCQTFDNPPLCSDIDFEVKAVEVFGFM